MDGQLKSMKNEYSTHVTSETVLGIQEPPAHMCSDLDEVIKLAKDTLHAVEQINGSDEHDDKWYVDSARGDIGYIPSAVENIRTQVEDLRQWGQEWKDLAKRLMEDSNVDVERYI